MGTNTINQDIGIQFQNVNFLLSWLKINCIQFKRGRGLIGVKVRKFVNANREPTLNEK